jgi:starch synthase
MMKKPLKLLYLASEATPFAKSGGLADVAAAFPAVLKKLGIDVRLVLPFYSEIRDKDVNLTPCLSGLEVPFADHMIKSDVLETKTEDGVSVYFLVNDDLYDRPGLYGSGTGDYEDNFQRFAFYCHGALKAAEAVSFHPNVIHCNDWQTGLVPTLMKTYYKNAASFEKTSTVFTIHNLGYQGLFPPKTLTLAGISPNEVLHAQGLEYWGNISLLKAGIVYSDAVTTVSSTYAREIQTQEYGMGMEGVLQERKEDLYGILNGVDYDTWNPESDQHIANLPSYGSPGKRIEYKRALIKEMGIDPGLENRPLLGIVSRLDEQKGFDLLLTAIDDLLELNVAIALLGSGNREIEEQILAKEIQHSGKIGVKIGFDESLAHRIMAGTDMLLVPSRYEPCGLTQLYAMKYGTIPIVRATGGLEDATIAFDPQTGEGNGFKFAPYDPLAFLEVVEQALDVFQDKDDWHRIVENAKKANFSWVKSAREYIDVYLSILKL